MLRLPRRRHTPRNYAPAGPYPGPNEEPSAGYRPAYQNSGRSSRLPRNRRRLSSFKMAVPRSRCITTCSPRRLSTISMPTAAKTFLSPISICRRRLQPTAPRASTSLYPQVIRRLSYRSLIPGISPSITALTTTVTTTRSSSLQLSSSSVYCGLTIICNLRAISGRVTTC